MNGRRSLVKNSEVKCGFDTLKDYVMCRNVIELKFNRLLILCVCVCCTVENLLHVVCRK